VKEDLLKQKGSEIWSVNYNDKIRAAAIEMEKRRIGALMVKDDKKNNVGIITARDFQRAIAEYAPHKLGDIATHSLMTPMEKVHTATTQAMLQDVAELMITHNVRHIPIFSGQENVGMLSIKDVVRAVLELDQYEKSYMEKWIRETST